MCCWNSIAKFGCNKETRRVKTHWHCCFIWMKSWLEESDWMYPPCNFSFVYIRYSLYISGIREGPLLGPHFFVFPATSVYKGLDNELMRWISLVRADVLKKKIWSELFSNAWLLSNVPFYCSCSGLWHQIPSGCLQQLWIVRMRSGFILNVCWYEISYYCIIWNIGYIV